MFSATELASLRRLDEATMDRVVDIITRVRVSDDAGGSIYTETTQSNVSCRRSPNLAGNVETSFGGQLESGLQWLFSFPIGTVITRDDEIVDGTQLFAVMGVLGPRTFEMTRQVVATEK